MTLYKQLVLGLVQLRVYTSSRHLDSVRGSGAGLAPPSPLNHARGLCCTQRHFLLLLLLQDSRREALSLDLTEPYIRLLRRRDLNDNSVELGAQLQLIIDQLQFELSKHQLMVGSKPRPAFSSACGNSLSFILSLSLSSPPSLPHPLPQP